MGMRLSTRHRLEVLPRLIRRGRRRLVTAHHRRDRPATAASATTTAPAAALTGTFTGGLRRLAAACSWRTWLTHWRLAAGSGTIRRRSTVDGRRVTGDGRVLAIARSVDHGALERSRTPLVELEPAADRLDTHLQVLHFDAQSRRFDDQIVNQLVEKLI